MPQFLIKKDAINSDTATITGDDAHHITSVLRLRVGDWIVLTDGEGHRWRSKLTEVGKKQITAHLTEPLQQPEQKTSITLAQSVIKPDRMEWVIQKSVELGCAKIIPITTERTIPRLKNETSEKKISRWQKIAIEAMKQCGASYTPVISELSNFKDLIIKSKNYSKAILFFEGEDKARLRDIFNSEDLKEENILIIIGPEGGFSKEEIDLARATGVVTAGLGPLILRVETAAIASLTLVQEMTGYFDKLPV